MSGRLVSGIGNPASHERPGASRTSSADFSRQHPKTRCEGADRVYVGMGDARRGGYILLQQGTTPMLLKPMGEGAKSFIERCLIFPLSTGSAQMPPVDGSPIRRGRDSSLPRGPYSSLATRRSLEPFLSPIGGSIKGSRYRGCQTSLHAANIGS
jgi:hypothetical protein